MDISVFETHLPLVDEKICFTCKKKCNITTHFLETTFCNLYFNERLFFRFSKEFSRIKVLMLKVEISPKKHNQIFIVNQFLYHRISLLDLYVYLIFIYFWDQVNWLFHHFAVVFFVLIKVFNFGLQVGCFNLELIKLLRTILLENIVPSNV